MVVALSGFLSVVATGCGGNDCEKLYEIEKKCVSNDKAEDFPSKELFVKACTEFRNKSSAKDEIASQMSCASETTCEGYATCKKARVAKRRAKDVTKAVAEQDWKDVFTTCTLNAEYYADEAFKAECNKAFASVPDDLNDDAVSRLQYSCKDEEVAKLTPELGKACSKIIGGKFKALAATARADRDAGKGEYKTCLQLTNLAETVGDGAMAEAKVLCSEIDAADDASKAIAKARANIASKDPKVPHECGWAIEKVGKVQTEWGKKALTDLLKTCYVDLGMMVYQLKGTPAEAKYSCPLYVERVSEAITKYELAAAYPEIVEAQKKLPKTCAKRS
ncbi:MAG: hypothetical protein AB7P03_17375 [Kofleriaceae bacterium]